jgi:hypothetical protein
MRLLAFCLLAMCAQPALADITATYEKPDKSFSMTVELADNGDLRGSVTAKPGSYFLVRNGQCYGVIKTPAGLVVDRCEDLMTAVVTVAEERTPGYQKLMKDSAQVKLPDQPYFAKGEEVTIRGRTGLAWYPAMPAGAPRPSPVLVISQDPDLAPLGTAMVRQVEMSERMQPFAAASDNPFSRQFKDLLKSGAAIYFADAELTTVSHDAIPPSRFELPGPVESLAEVVKRVRANNTGTYIQAF